MSGDTFDWLKEYGPHWQPGSLAFWLAPETPEQMVEWLAKYRPELLPQPSPAEQIKQQYEARGMLNSASHLQALNSYQSGLNAYNNPFGGITSGALGKLL